MTGLPVKAAESLTQQINGLQQRVAQLEDLTRQPDSIVHLSGYGLAGYSLAVDSPGDNIVTASCNTRR